MHLLKCWTVVMAVVALAVTASPVATAGNYICFADHACISAAATTELGTALDASISPRTNTRRLADTAPAPVTMLQCKHVIGYSSLAADIASLPVEMLTHMILESNGAGATDQASSALRQRNANLRVLQSNVHLDAAWIHNLARGPVAEMQKSLFAMADTSLNSLKFDGIHLSLSDSMAGPHLVPLLAELKAQLALVRTPYQKPAGLLSVTVPWSATPVSGWTAILGEIAAICDFVTVDTVSVRIVFFLSSLHLAHQSNAKTKQGKRNPSTTAFHASYASLRSGVSAFRSAGVPAAKLHARITYDSQAYPGVDMSFWTPSAPGTKYFAQAAAPGRYGDLDGRISYDSLMGGYGLSTGYLYRQDYGAKSLTVYSPIARVWISAEDPWTVQAKAQLVAAEGLGGVLVTDLASDTRHGHLMTATLVAAMA
ncbi:glycosyl hydrolases family 18-domain-containing protein [Blastocladiella britannica]|nr:glycosyl hydrolases family 18-domain-containing protein [Blastocladiella britannica]